MSRQSSFMASVQLDLCCDITLLVATYFLLVLLRLCRDKEKLCQDISALYNFSPFLAGIVSFSFKTCKTQSW